MHGIESPGLLTKHLHPPKSVNHEGIDQVAKGCYGDPPACHEKLLQGAEPKSFIQKGTVVWFRQALVVVGGSLWGQIYAHC